MHNKYLQEVVGFAHGEKLTISAWLHQASSPLLAWEDTQAPVTPGMPFCSKAEEIPLTIRVQTRAMYQQTPLLPLTSTPPSPPNNTLTNAPPQS